MSPRTYRRLQRDLATTHRAILVKTLRGWRRLSPQRYVVLEPVYSSDAVAAAKDSGQLVEESHTAEASKEASK